MMKILKMKNTKHQKIDPLLLRQGWKNVLIKSRTIFYFFDGQ